MKFSIIAYLHQSLYILLLLFCLLDIRSTHGQDIFFGDEEPPLKLSPISSSTPHGPTERRPQFGAPFNINNIVRNPIQAISSGIQNIVSGFVSPITNSGNGLVVTPPPRNSGEDGDEPVADCRTFRNSGGYCMPLPSCDSLQKLLSNRPQITVNRILRRSICGFSGFNTLVCCPEPTGNIFNGGDPIISTSQFPNFPSTQFTTPRPNNINPSTFFTTTTKRTINIRPPTDPFENSGPIALLPPKKPTQRPSEIVENGANLELRTGCGFSNASHSRIVGGREAQKGAWPWIAALGYRDSSGSINYLCGGSLISKWHILTAGHCVHDRKDLAMVRLGDHDLFSDSDGLTPLNIPIDEIFKSPKYNSKTFQNDLAIIKLKEPVKFTLGVHPICLPSSPSLRFSTFEDITPYVAGWGAVEFNGPSSAVLKETQLPTVPNAECEEKYRPFKNTQVDGSNICAGLKRGGQDACQGDSGGPLMQPIDSNSYVQIGVVSFGFKCAEPGFPGVYTRVTSHIDWIEETVRNSAL